MIDQVLKLVLLLVGALMVGVVIYNWEEIADAVARWLRNNNLSKSSLMKIWIFFDRVVSGVKYQLFVRTKNGREQSIKESHMELEQLRREDPGVYEELQRRGYATKDITDNVMCSLH